MAASALPIEEMANEKPSILHGTKHGNHVHALSQPSFSAGDKIWLTIQQWNGELLTLSWELPAHYFAAI
ncbi:conserved hypothetical protein [Alteromonas sp. 38]|uniref:hypothetical protein n=1 Tax=Alteromonas TaxID=226 RepID=UPI0012F21406|nr:MULTISPECIES: hypothetical protein [Alteromonas]CAD5269092.1 conserved hypothetical protein [Alteromonas sp. 154]VXC00427.1 conserved hypothetical protein [Alteromonas sp. 38]